MFRTFRRTTRGTVGRVEGPANDAAARGRATRPAPLSFPAGPGGLLIAAPDDYTDTFDPPRVDDQTNRDGETELTYVEYSTDLDPNDTTIETTYVFFIKRGGDLRVEVDNHTTGLFPVGTWERLVAEAGFEVDRVDYLVSADGRGCGWGWRFPPVKGN